MFKKHFKTIVAFLLVMIVVLCLSFALTACKKGSKNNDAATTRLGEYYEETMHDDNLVMDPFTDDFDEEDAGETTKASDSGKSSSDSDSSGSSSSGSKSGSSGNSGGSQSTTKNSGSQSTSKSSGSQSTTKSGSGNTTTQSAEDEMGTTDPEVGGYWTGWY